MKLSVHVIVHPDDATDTAPVIREVFALDRDRVTPDTLGLPLSEAKNLLAAVHDTLVEHQVQRAVAAEVACPHRGRARRRKAPAPSSCAPCSASYTCPAPAGGTAPAKTSQPAPSSP